MISQLEESNNIEPLNPEQRIRIKGMPVGLKNIGNSLFLFFFLTDIFFLKHAISIL